MSTLTASAERTIAASPEALYDIVADFTTHHARILPPAFSDFRVESGGIGVGTVTSSRFTIAGRTDTVRTRVVRAERGRVLEEVVLGRPMQTTFTFRPDVSGARVAIDTTWQPSRGPLGFLERRLIPSRLSRIYADELDRLAAYVASLRSEESPPAAA
jgi:hypothetical protein